MKILLVAMPDTANVIDYVGRLPNLALVSIAGNLPDHEVKTIDLVLHKPAIRHPLEEALRTFKPDLVGLSAMTFQFSTLIRIARFIRETAPGTRIAAGGYHATLMAEDLVASEPDLPLDFLVRGEGEATFGELAAALSSNRRDFHDVLGLSWREGDHWNHNPARPLLDLSQIRLPNRSARLSRGFSYLGIPMDTAETSRGCPCNCKFCSITRMYGRTFRPFPMERIIEDLRRIQSGGAKAVFLVDDNITWNIDHFRSVCRAIADNGLNRMLYAVQVTAVGIANNPELVAEMDRANFRTVFVGFESMLPAELKGMNKPTNPDINRRAADLLHRHNMGIIAGIIVGYPDDTEKSIATSFKLFRELQPDMIYAQYLTPYPKTPLRDEMLEAGLVANIDNYDTYDGFTCNVRTRHLTRERLHQCLKKECMKFSLRPSQLWNNFFLKKYPAPLLLSVVKTAVSDLYNIFTARRMPFKFDI